MRGIQGKVALITGAGRGIGSGTALRLAEEGAGGIVLNDLDEEPLQEAVRAVQEKGCKCVGLAGSVTDPELAGKLVRLATESFGDLHLVALCAGFTWDGVIHRMSDEQWQSIIDVHLTGSFRVLREAMRFMRERAQKEREGGGEPPARKIVTISSRSAFGNFGQANYSSAKAGLLGLARTVALEGAPFNILANAVAFGMVDTRLTQEKELGETTGGGIALGIPKELREQVIQLVPLKRMGTVEEAAGSIAFLLSDDAGYVTGHTLEVNGGRHM